MWYLAVVLAAASVARATDTTPVVARCFPALEKPQWLCLRDTATVPAGCYVDSEAASLQESIIQMANASAYIINELELSSQRFVATVGDFADWWSREYDQPDPEGLGWRFWALLVVLLVIATYIAWPEPQYVASACWSHIRCCVGRIQHPISHRRAVRNNVVLSKAHSEVEERRFPPGVYQLILEYAVDGKYPTVPVRAVDIVVAHQMDYALPPAEPYIVALNGEHAKGQPAGVTPLSLICDYADTQLR